MNSHVISLNGNRRPRRPLARHAAVPDHRTAAAMDDASAAEQLIEDLLALIDAGLVVPVEDGGEIRYAPVEPEERDAA
jgi:hypothetical protein